MVFDILLKQLQRVSLGNFVTEEALKQQAIETVSSVTSIYFQVRNA